jgi:drug/metabolite transporter (DMT)-like permease
VHFDAEIPARSGSDDLVIRTAVTLAATASLAWGIADLLAGVWTRRVPVRVVLAYSKVAGFVAVALLAAVVGTRMPSDARLWWAALAGVAGVPAMGLLYLAIRSGPLAVVAPVAAGAALVPVVWDLAHGARLSGAAVVGAGAALLGITLASLPPGGLGRLRDLRTLPYAGLAAVLLGAYFVLLHEAGTVDPLWATVVARASGAVTAVLVLAVPMRPTTTGEADPTAAAGQTTATGRMAGPGRIRESGVAALNRTAAFALVGISFIGVLDAGADRAFATASLIGGLGPAAVLSSLYPAVTVLLGIVLLRERVRGLHAVGVVAALAGAALLGVG